MNTPYEYYVIKYANQWKVHEEPLHKALSGKSFHTTDISKALQFFQVARTFKGLKLEDKKVFISNALVKHSKGLNKGNYSVRVQSLSDELETEFGTNNISASSKLLWLRKRSPIVIMDQWAKIAVIDKCKLKKNIDYNTFSEHWRELFREEEGKLAKACSKLVKAKKFSALYEVEEGKVKEIAESEWFKERVFDLSLLDSGKSI
jgi:hypothetical protein